MAKKRAAPKPDGPKKSAETAALTRARLELLEAMSAEVVGPMESVMNMVQLLLDSMLDDEQRRQVGVIRSSGQSLLNLLNDTIEYSQLESEDLESENRPFDLRVAIQDVERQLMPIANEKGLAFECKVDHDVPSRLLGDPGRLRQVLLNLSTAAMRLTEKNTVTLQVGRKDEDQASVTLRFAVTYAVPKGQSDTISGVLAAYRAEDPHAPAVFGGARLAYAIARRLVLMLGGELGVDFTPDGSRTRSWFELAVEKEVAKPEDAEVAAVVSVGEKKAVGLEGSLVMVVDSSASTRRSLVEALQSWGCVVVEAEKSAMALIQLRKAAQANKPFRVVLVEKELADGGAFELAKVVRADRRLGDAKLLLLTASGQRGDAATAAEMGFAAYLLKPLQAPELRAALESVLFNAARGVQELVTRHTLAEARQRDVRLLMVEDSAVDQLVSQWALERLGYKVDVAGSAAAALAACEEQNFALILLDLQLPDGNGYEIVTELRRREEAASAPRTPIVAITADVMPGTRERCLVAGMDDYLGKPVDLEALCSTVAKWLKAGSNQGVGADLGPDPAASATESDDDAPWEAAELTGVGEPEAKGAATPAKPATPAAKASSARPATPAKPVPPAVKIPVAAPPPAPAPASEFDEGDQAEAQRRRRSKFLELSGRDLLDFESRGTSDDEDELLPTLDLARLEEMCMGVPALRDQLLNTFLAEIGPRLERLEAAVVGAAVADVVREAHALKGMMGTIGARAGAEMFGVLESLASEGQIAGLPPILKRAEREAARARRAIENLPFREAA